MKLSRLRPPSSMRLARRFHTCWCEIFRMRKGSRLEFGISPGGERGQAGSQIRRSVPRRTAHFLCREISRHTPRGERRLSPHPRSGAWKFAAAPSARRSRAFPDSARDPFGLRRPFLGASAPLRESSLGVHCSSMVGILIALASLEAPSRQINLASSAPSFPPPAPLIADSTG
jgi:hypothetical protein